LLQELHVINFGIIEDIDWKLDAGLNVITGETGAGKSLIIDAVEILLNGSSSEEVIRHGCTEARIEGIFAVPDEERFRALRSFLNEKGIPPEDDLLIISYDIKQGKNGQVRINGRTITRGILRQTGRLLIDIHGQSQHLSLLDEDSHLGFLDGLAQTATLKAEFASQISELRTLETELAGLQSRQEETLRQQEFLRYQIDEIEQAAVHAGEDEELQKERLLISHAARLKEEAAQIYRALDQNDSGGYSPSVVAALHQAVQSLKKLSELDNRLNQPLEDLEKAYYSVAETARDIAVYAEKLEFDPHRQEEVEARLDRLNKLKRKYGQSLEAIIAYQARSQRDLDSLGNSQERQIELRAVIAAARTSCGKTAEALSEARQRAALILTAAVKKELHDLEMGPMDFTVAITRMPAEKGLPGADGRCFAYNQDGFDKVLFMASTNPGEPLQPLVKIASTGELSRFTLALKGALAEADRIPVLIFDEIDIGVGGRSGEIVGKKLWKLARHHQVVCITHLPQIAALADAHYFVHKQTAGQRTVSSLEHLDPESRLKEMALMLAGPDYSSAALKNCRELLNKAAAWKKSQVSQNDAPA
jgi:DNA repair protein RecN (Recombination protein N)